MSSVSDDWLGFEVLTSVYINDLLVVNVDEVLPVVLEDEPPEARGVG